MASFLIGCSSSGPNPQVLMETSMGNVKIELFQSKAPITVKNFLAYVDNHHYDGTVFHRVIGDFMIQGGGLRPDLTEKTTLPPIRNESSNGLYNESGTIAMARLPDPDSATSQFFINVADNRARLPPPGREGYTVFGRVIDGMDVVDKIRQVRTASRGPHDDVPVEPVVIKSIRRVELPKPAQ
jgi:cyclophilin family peptidyl-prolyl cis-trans isomerase